MMKMIAVPSLLWDVSIERSHWPALNSCAWGRPTNSFFEFYCAWHWFCSWSGCTVSLARVCGGAWSSWGSRFASGQRTGPRGSHPRQARSSRPLQRLLLNDSSPLGAELAREGTLRWNAPAARWTWCHLAAHSRTIAPCSACASSQVSIARFFRGLNSTLATADDSHHLGVKYLIHVSDDQSFSRLRKWDPLWDCCTPRWMQSSHWSHSERWVTLANFQPLASSLLRLRSRCCCC